MLILYLLKRGDTINLLPQLKRDIANIALTKLKMKNIFSFIVPYALEKVFNLFSIQFISVYLSKNHSPKEKHLKVTVCLLPNIAFII